MADEPDVIILRNDNGERVGFAPVATVLYEDSTYIILKPITPMEGTDEGDAFVFSVSQVDADRAEDSCSYLAMVTDESVVNAVFDLYEQNP